jgi:hypothetical protein
LASIFERTTSMIGSWTRIGFPPFELLMPQAPTVRSPVKLGPFAGIAGTSRHVAPQRHVSFGQLGGTS